jgi:hypothetical protein
MTPHPRDDLFNLDSRVGFIDRRYIDRYIRPKHMPRRCVDRQRMDARQ